MLRRFDDAGVAAWAETQCIGAGDARSLQRGHRPSDVTGVLLVILGDRQRFVRRGGDDALGAARFAPVKDDPILR